MPGNNDIIIIYIIIIFSSHNCSEDEKLPNLDVTATTSSEQVVPVRERKHFHFNINKTGYVIFSVSYAYEVTRYVHYMHRHLK